MLPPIVSISTLPPTLPNSTEPELFETIAKGNDVLIERIVSTGHTTPDGFWYEQETDEWVLLLQGAATLLFDHNEGETLVLMAGQAILIPARRRHRVVFTSSAPPCIWLAVHGKLS